MSVDSTKTEIKKKDYLLLHAGFLVYSFSAVFLKLASTREMLSIHFGLFWGIGVTILLLYAILWQIILGKFPLSTAFANRGVVVAWGIFWGYFIFEEQITPGKISAAILILIGIIILSRAKKDDSLGEVSNVGKTDG
jgi:multidrug transporter EmrE-like cation transporter